MQKAPVSPAKRAGPFGSAALYGKACILQGRSIDGDDIRFGQRGITF